MKVLVQGEVYNLDLAYRITPSNAFVNCFLVDFPDGKSLVLPMPNVEVAREFWEYVRDGVKVFGPEALLPMWMEE